MTPDNANANTHVSGSVLGDGSAHVGSGSSTESIANASAPGRDGFPRRAVGPRPSATDMPATSRTPRGGAVGSGVLDGVVVGQERDRLAAGLGARLSELRAAKGLTQVQAARLGRITERHWRYLVRGERRPSADLVGLLALVLADVDPWAVLEELLSLGGDALSGSGRRRFRKAARVALAARMAEPKVRASTARTLRRTLALADRLEAAGAVEQAASIRAATERIALHADGASADGPLTSKDAGRAGSVRTPRLSGGAK